MARAFDLEFALKQGVTITMDEIAADEFQALKLIAMERDRFQNEKHDE